MSLALGQNETYINKVETGQPSVSMDFFQTFRKLSPNQAEHIYEIMKCLTNSLTEY